MSLRKKNYLNNRDLMHEIHQSKNSYSSYTSPEYNMYDIIVADMSEIPDNIDAARQNRIARSLKEFNTVLTEQDVLDSDLIFRVMTFDHIPTDQSRKRTPKTVAEHHVKLNFPPFQHWKYDESGFLRCVGKSHWHGDVETGYFSKTHGSATDNLAKMWMKLCERYCTRGNVRSYTYNDEMQGHALVQLVEVGLQFNEAKSNNPFSYSTTVIANACVRVINNEKTNQLIRDDILELNDMDTSYTYQHQHEWDAALRRNLTESEIERMDYVQKGCNVYRPSSRS